MLVLVNRLSRSLLVASSSPILLSSCLLTVLSSSLSDCSSSFEVSSSSLLDWSSSLTDISSSLAALKLLDGAAAGPPWSSSARPRARSPGPDRRARRRCAGGGRGRRGCARRRLVFEGHQPQPLGFARDMERLDRDPDAAGTRCRGAPGPPVTTTRWFSRIACGRRHGVWSRRPLRACAMTSCRRQTGRLRQVLVGRAVKIQDLAGAVDDHAGRGITLEQLLLGQGGEPRPRSASRRDRRSGSAPRRGGDGKLHAVVPCRSDAPVDPPLLRTPPRRDPPAARRSPRCPGTGTRLRRARNAASAMSRSCSRGSR